jgi:hypothetical protein
VNSLFRLGDIAPAGGVAGTAEIVLDAVLEDTCHVFLLSLSNFQIENEKW